MEIGEELVGGDQVSALHGCVKFSKKQIKVKKEMCD